jgi:hypothetical protein
MRRIRWLLALLLPLLASAQADLARAQEVVNGGVIYADSYGGSVVDAGVVGPYAPWHSGYHSATWGQPVALVVPPTATHQTNWGWGIGNTRITPIQPQFIGPMTATASQYQYGRTRPTPHYVSDTLQLGVYYIRGPW